MIEAKYESERLSNCAEVLQQEHFWQDLVLNLKRISLRSKLWKNKFGLPQQAGVF